MVDTRVSRGARWVRRDGDLSRTCPEQATEAAGRVARILRLELRGRKGERGR